MPPMHPGRARFLETERKGGAMTGTGKSGRIRSYVSGIAALALLLLFAPMPLRVWAADAGRKPSEVPLVSVGQHYFGNTNTHRRPIMSAKQGCLSRLERPPHNVKSEMLEPARTEIQTTGSYRSAPGCDGLQGIGQHRAQIKDHGRWTGIQGDGWYPSANSNGGSFNFLDIATRGVKERKVHGHWEPAREQFRVIVRDPRTHKVISRGKIRNYRVKIDHKAAG
jgi:hypothetical protein